MWNETRLAENIIRIPSRLADAEQRNKPLAARIARPANTTPMCHRQLSLLLTDALRAEIYDRTIHAGRYTTVETVERGVHVTTTNKHGCISAELYVAPHFIDECTSKTLLGADSSALIDQFNASLSEKNRIDDKDKHHVSHLFTAESQTTTPSR